MNKKTAAKVKNMQSLENAISIALEAHRGQIDQSGAPYILHPLRLMMQMNTEEEMIEALGARLEGRGLRVAIIDVDADAATRARFGLMVPVLTLDGNPVCNGRLDPDVLDDLF